MLNTTKQDERDLAILKISNRNKILSDELNKNQMILQRTFLLIEETPKDQVVTNYLALKLTTFKNPAQLEFSF
jgi:hypothetical protein